METAKLTLRPSKHVVELAHQIAAEDNTSVTQIFSALILARENEGNATKRIPLGPLTRSVTGLAKVPADWDYKKELENALVEKYVGGDK